MSDFDKSYASLKRKYVTCGNKIKAINEAGRVALVDETQVNAFKAMHKSLDRYYQKSEDIWDEIADLFDESGKTKEFPYSGDSTLQVGIERYFNEAHMNYENILEKTKTIPPTINASIIESQASSFLPKMNLPHFSGDLTQWPKYRDAFVSIVHEDANVPNIRKFHYLITSVSGPALVIVNKLPLTSENYDVAWKALNDCYDNKRLLASAYLNELINFKALQGKPTIQTLQQFLTKVSENISALKLLKIPNESEFILYHLAIKCLDQHTREQFELSNQGTTFPTFDSLVEFIRNRCLALQLSDHTPHSEAVTGAFSKPNPQSRKGSGAPKQNPHLSRTSLFTSKSAANSMKELQSNAKVVKNIQCPACDNNHRLLDCLKFTEASAPQRIHMLKSWQGCRNCLFSGHKTRECSSKWHCRFCNLRHHSLLHLGSSSKNLEKTEVLKSDESSTSLSSTTSNEGEQVVLGTTLVQIKDERGYYQTIRAVIDSGSQSSFITQKCANLLGLTIKPHPRKITGIGCTLLESAKGKVVCSLKPKDLSSPTLLTEAVVVSNITSNLPSVTLPTEIWQQYKSYTLADPEFWKPGPIDFLLGCDLFTDIWSGNTITLRDEWPKLFSSIFGNVVMGKLKSHSTSPDTSTTLFVTSFVPDLRDELKRFWELEEPLKHSIPVDPEDIACENHFVQTHYRTKEGKYVVRLPFKECDIEIGDSFTQALTRFQKLENGFKKNPQLQIQYNDFMTEYNDLGHMSETRQTSKYVIPHHPVVKEDRGKIKLRVVFDGSSRTTKGSLNEKLMIGPKLQTDIKVLLLNFRSHPVVFVTDVVKMYRNILTDSLDRPYQHILWRFHPEDQLKRYELNTLTYGLAPAPFLILRVIQQLRADEGLNFPKASEVLSRDIYIDDIVTGSSSVETALELQEETIELMKKGGFSLSKWASNKQELLHAVDKNQSNEHLELKSNEEFVKVLGLVWDPKSDCFYYRVHPPALIYSKRAILSTIAKIYDPLGFLSPVILQAKLLMQELWKDGLGWDEAVPENIQTPWENFIAQLPSLSSIKVPRYLFREGNYTFQIIGFSDASEKGFSAALYLRTECNDEVCVNLITGKSKPAPIKTLSIPRLELCGALLLAKLYASLCSFLNTSVKKPNVGPFLFTDSTIVLSWIQTPTYKLKTFVANRIVEILEHTPGSAWRHVRSEHNPSDCCSRGLSPNQLVNHELWWEGPNWLKLPLHKWPKLTDVGKEDLPDLKETTQNTLLTAPTEEPFLMQWMKSLSSYTLLLKAIAWCLRLSYNFRHKEAKLIGSIRVNEFTNALTVCVKLIQSHYFCEGNSQTLNYASQKKLKNLSPFFDEAGVLRVGGRLNHAEVPHSHKHPILLPHNCHFTVLLTDYFHKIYLHPGPNLLQALIQTQFWIPSLRSLVRRRVFLCIKCYKANSRSKSFVPIMGDLPKSRLIGKRSFLHTGVDFAGPFQMRESLRRKAPIGKVYLCIFVCMATKAVHLEAVTSLTTEAFLASLSRFTSRRGLPQQMYSDCGTNFQGARNKLKQLQLWFNKESTRSSILQFSTTNEISWNFNPPNAPHFGGIWEAAVKSAKRHLTAVAGDTPLTYEEISTLFTRIESVLNSRPLCPLSTNPEENNYLSPGHFLIGDTLLAYPEPTLVDCKDHILTRWQLVNKMRDHFWKRWKLEYLSTLQKKPKWHDHKPNIQEGSLVLIKDQNSPFLQWPTAKVLQVHPGSDNVVRVVTLRTAKSTFKRPVAQVVPLLPLQVTPYDI